MYPIDLSGRHALVLGVANHRSLAWAIAQALHRAGASLCLTYAGERLQKTVEELVATIPGALVLPCDVNDDAQIDAVAKALGPKWGSIEMLVHGRRVREQGGSRGLVRGPRRARASAPRSR
jgi:enoyl-[acyl-carrier protein] reductase I